MPNPKNYLLLLSIFFVLKPAVAQKESHYLFTGFQTATIYFHNGTNQQNSLNYNTLTEEMVFVEAGKYLAIANMDAIDSIRIGDRKFIPEGNVFYEWLNGGTYPLFEQHKSKLLSAGKATGFGTSQTTAVDNIANVFSSGKVYELEIDKEYQVLADKVFWVWVNTQYRRINSLKDAEEIFPETGVKSIMKTYRLKFNNPDDIIKLMDQLNKTP